MSHRHRFPGNGWAGRWLPALLLAAIMVLSGTVTYSALQAGGISTALYQMVATITNAGSVDQGDLSAALNLSAASLIDDGFIADDALNTIAHKGTTDIPVMPATNRIRIEGVVLKDDTTFTEYTAAAQNTTLNDVPLLPAAPVAGEDATFFGFDNPARILTLDEDTAGVGTWTLDWEYWNGSSYTNLSNVDDRTSAFTALGRRTVSWDMPTDWATTTVTGSAVSAYWMRAQVDTFTSITTQPLASRGFYENGQWWAWVEDLDTDNQQQYTLYLGGTALQTYHPVFPGTAGIITDDDSSMELGSSYAIGINGRLNFAAPGVTVCLVCKTGVMTVNVSGSAVSPAIGVSITGGGTTAFDVTGISTPATGSQWVILASDGTTMAALANAGGGLSTGPAQSVTDNGNSWTWASNDGIDYFDSIRLSTSAPTVFDMTTSYTNWATGTHTNTQAYTGALGLDN